jgi:predicted MFS family arabinose efflux permease
MAAALTPARRQELDRSQRWWALVVTLTASGLTLAGAVGPVSLIPTISRTLGASLGGIALAVAIYVVAFATIAVTGGRLGERAGYRPLLIGGLLLFSLGAILSALSPALPLLICGRVLQGLGSGLFYPQTVSALHDLFDEEERPLALGIFAAVMFAAAALGLLLVGALGSTGLTWRLPFLAEALIGVATAIASMTTLPEMPETELVPVDGGGVALLGLTLVALVLPLPLGAELGWPAWLVVLMVASPLSLLILAWEQQHRSAGGRRPLLDPQLLSQPAFLAGSLIILAGSAAAGGLLLMVPLMLEVGLHLSSVSTGLLLLPAGSVLALSSGVTPRLVRSMRRHVLSAGFTLLAVGLLLTGLAVSRTGTEPSTWALLPGLALVGAGLGISMTSLPGVVLSSQGSRSAGPGAEILATFSQAGLAVGIAGASMLVTLLSGSEAGASGTRYLMAARIGLPLLAGLAIAALALVFTLPHERRASALLVDVPSRASGLAYSLFLLTGGRLPDRVLRAFVAESLERRALRSEPGPRPLGDLLIHNFQQAAEENAWHKYLLEEAQALGGGPIPHREERQAFLQGQVAQLKARQVDGLISTEFDPAAIELMVLALAGYPRLFPQIARMTIGHAPDTPEFREQWNCFLRQLGARLSRRSLEPATSQQPTR